MTAYALRTQSFDKAVSDFNLKHAHLLEAQKGLLNVLEKQRCWLEGLKKEMRAFLEEKK